MTLYNMGLLYEDTQRYAEAFHSFYESMEIYKRLAIKDASKQKYYEYALSNLRYIYQYFQETDGVPSECEAEVEKIKRLLEE